MLIAREQLQELLRLVLRQRLQQGCDLDPVTFEARIEAAADSYDGLYALALELRDPPLRADWPYQEPLDWDGIVTESEHLHPQQAWQRPDLETAAERARAGFLGSVCGCMLGKPIEVNPTLAELREAAGKDDAWPLADYVSTGLLERLGRRHESWQQTVRDAICAVAADDDIHYTLIGMLLLENCGAEFSSDDLYRTWADNIAPGWSWGPERSMLLRAATSQHHFFPGSSLQDTHDVLLLNPGDEMCGALIRADAYGYACPGNPDLAARLAWQDASFTHIKTGVYGAMFVAALIALCHEAGPMAPGNDRLELVTEALRRLPARCRFGAVVRDSLNRVMAAADWESGYAAVHGQYRQYSHCQVYQEVGTLVNTLKFADSVGHGIGLQVSQGNDTDSFGATAGSILGVLLGPEQLESRWLAPFDNRIQHALAALDEHRLDKLAERLGQLPARLYEGLAGNRRQER